MKTVTKVLAVVMALVLALSIAACGKANSVVGHWDYNLSVKALVEGVKSLNNSDMDPTELNMYTELLKAFDGVEMTIKLELNDDNTYRFYTDAESVQLAAEQIKNNIVDVLPAAFAAVGMDEAAMNSYLESAGMTMEQLAESFAEQMNANDLIESTDDRGTYRVEDNKLYFTANGAQEDTSKYVEFKLSATELELTNVEGNALGFDEYENFIFPMIFKKV